ncbi:MAG: DUF3574 domain-containing protein [Caulobacterales bacterium]
MIALVLAAGAQAASAAPASATNPAPHVCPAGLHPATTAELFFGRSDGQELAVSDDDWATFVSEEVTPRFPDGLTVSDVYGQWHGDKGFVREPSKALFVVITHDYDDQVNLSYVREAYKQRFNQQSVLLVEAPACVAF